MQVLIGAIRWAVALVVVLALASRAWGAAADEPPAIPFTDIPLPETQRVVIAGALLSAAAAALGLHYARNAQRKQRWMAAMSASLAMGVVMGLLASWIDSQHRRSEYRAEQSSSAPGDEHRPSP
jgi:peptidoglycan/LPS O-acetylase OafA/YrhL